MDSLQPPDNVHDYTTCVMWMKQNQGRIANRVCRERFNWLVCEGAGFVAENFLGQDTICDWCRRMYPGSIQQSISVAQGRRVQEHSYQQRSDSNCTGNCFNGSGKGEWMGNVYVGTWRDAKPHGKGTLLRDFYDNNSKVYSGYWRDGEYNGYGIEYGDNGSIKYKGYFSNNTYHGNGTLYFGNGKTEYSGYWKNGIKHGKGVWYYDSGKVLFRGGFKEGMKDGFGIDYSEYGIIYKGYFRDNFYNGSGVLYHENGKIAYHGTLERGQAQGKGTEYYQNGRVKFRGTFQQGNPSGEGVWYEENGNKVEHKSSRNVQNPFIILNHTGKREKQNSDSQGRYGVFGGLLQNLK